MNILDLDRYLSKEPCDLDVVERLNTAELLPRNRGRNWTVLLRTVTKKDASSNWLPYERCIPPVCFHETGKQTLFEVLTLPGMKEEQKKRNNQTRKKLHEEGKPKTKREW